jgi:hypothetical protein
MIRDCHVYGLAIGVVFGLTDATLATELEDAASVFLDEEKTDWALVFC